MQPEDKEADRIRGHGFTYIVRPQTRERCQRKFKEHEDGWHKLERYNKNGLVLFGAAATLHFLRGRLRH